MTKGHVPCRCGCGRRADPGARGAWKPWPVEELHFYGWATAQAKEKGWKGPTALNKQPHGSDLRSRDSSVVRRICAGCGQAFARYRASLNAPPPANVGHGGVPAGAGDAGEVFVFEGGAATADAQPEGGIGGGAWPDSAAGAGAGDTSRRYRPRVASMGVWTLRHELQKARREVDMERRRARL